MAVCPQCNFDYEIAEASAIPTALTTVGNEFQARLRRTADPQLRLRPREGVWSALEYACHVRDVLLIQRDRMYLALVEDSPSFPRMYRDERAVLARYNEGDQGVVADQLSVAAALAADAFAGLDSTQLRRRLVYNWPEPRELDLLRLGAHTVHEGRHHLDDFDAVVAGLIPGRPG
jgi:DNA segregation ATPase FtsK/SpoIIIE, S-DNA-T family